MTAPKPPKQSLEQILDNFRAGAVAWDPKKGIKKAEARAAIIDWALACVPEKTGARWGSENAEVYRAHQRGFNQAIDTTVANIKESK